MTAALGAGGAPLPDEQAKPKVKPPRHAQGLGGRTGAVTSHLVLAQNQASAAEQCGLQSGVGCPSCSAGSSK